MKILRIFCDSYADRIYGHIADFFGSIYDRAGVPVGELIMYFVAVLLILYAVLLILSPLLNKKEGGKLFFKGASKLILSVVLIFVFIYVFNWLIPMNGSVLGLGIKTDTKYTLDEYEFLRNYVTEHMNEVAGEVKRDEDGEIIYPSREEMADEVVASMIVLSREYPRLSGYYPKMKAALCSDVLDWMDIGGYTYPYTMEITYNKYISDLYYPALYAHESSHHHGYYRENEANFLEYMACTTSDDPLLRYAGYIYVYDYVDSAYQSKLMEELSKEEAIERYDKQPVLDDMIFSDILSAQSDAKERYDNDPHPLEEYSDTAEKVADKGWDTQEKILKEDSYDGVVLLLLDYFERNVR